MLVELEAGTRACLMMVDAEVVRAESWGQPAVSELLERHAGPLELILGGLVMRLVTGRELVEVLRQVRPPVPMLLGAADRWPELQRRAASDAEAPRVVPFDPEVVAEHLERLRRLSDAA